MLERIVSFAVIALGLVGSAVAQPAGNKGPLGAICAKDIATICPGAARQSQQVRACLEQNKDRVSAPCKGILEATAGSDRPRR